MEAQPVLKSALNPKTLSCLPEELVVQILLRVTDYRNRYRLSAVNKDWNRLINTCKVWSDIDRVAFYCPPDAQYTEHNRHVYPNRVIFAELSLQLNDQCMLLLSHKRAINVVPQLLQLAKKSCRELCLSEGALTGLASRLYRYLLQWTLKHVFPKKSHLRLCVSVHWYSKMEEQHLDKQSRKEINSFFEYYKDAGSFKLSGVNLDENKGNMMLALISSIPNLTLIHNHTATSQGWQGTLTDKGLGDRSSVQSVFKDKPLATIDVYALPFVPQLLAAIQPGFLRTVKLVGCHLLASEFEKVSAASASLQNVDWFEYSNPVDIPPMNALQSTTLLCMMAGIMPKCTQFTLNDWLIQKMRLRKHDINKSFFLLSDDWGHWLRVWAYQLSEQRPLITVNITRPLPSAMQIALPDQLSDFHLVINKHKPKCELSCVRCVSGASYERYMQLFIKPNALSPFQLTVNITQYCGTKCKWPRQLTESDHEQDAEDGQLWEDADTDSDDASTDSEGENSSSWDSADSDEDWQLSDSDMFMDEDELQMLKYTNPMKWWMAGGAHCD